MPAPGLERAVSQDESRKLHDASVVLVEPVETDLRHVLWGKLNRRDVVQHPSDPSQADASRLRAQTHPAESRGSRLHQSVRQDVVRELVVAHLDWHGNAEPAPDLFVEPDTPTNGVLCLLLGEVVM